MSQLPIRSGRWFAIILLACCVGRAADVAADDDSGPQATHRGAVTDYSFEDEQVLADSVAPNGSWLSTRTRGARESLVRARLHFVDELCRAVEQL